MNDKYLELLGKLLRQAEGAGTEEEAATFVAKAQELSTRHSIDLEIARQHVADKTARQTPIARKITIGERGKKLLNTYCTLYIAIAASNDVTCDLAHNSTYVIAYGFESDIDVVDALYASLVLQMVEASNAYLRSGEYKNETVRRAVYQRDPWSNLRSFDGFEEKPVNGITARKSFQQGFARRVGLRLAEARKEAIAAAEADERDEPFAAHEATGTELVLRTKDIEIKDFYKSKSNARGTWRGARNTGSDSSHARRAGRAAGDRARLGGEKAIGGSRRELA